MIGNFLYVSAKEKTGIDQLKAVIIDAGIKNKNNELIEPEQTKKENVMNQAFGQKGAKSGKNENDFNQQDIGNNSQGFGDGFKGFVPTNKD